MNEEIYKTLYDSSDLKIHATSLLSDELEESSESVNSQSGQSLNVQNTWSLMVAAALEPVASFDPRPYGPTEKNSEKMVFRNDRWYKIESQSFSPTVEKPPNSMSAWEACQRDLGEQGVDFRPHLKDKKTGTFMLVDSGSQCSACPPDPGDQVDTSIALKAINGTQLRCYGFKEVEIKLGRKLIKYRLIKADVETTVLGWDFLRKNKLSMIWDELDEVYLWDRKSNTRTMLHCRPVAFDRPQKLSVLKAEQRPVPQSSHQYAFEVASMMSLGPENEEKVCVNDINKMPDGVYKDLLKKFPGILKLSFDLEKSKSGVIHRIDTQDHPPCRAKRRPMMPGSEKEKEAKKAWDELVQLGIVEAVDPSKPNNWSSAVHFAKKPGGGLRPVGDYRDLNKKTVLDLFPLPNLRSFHHKLAGGMGAFQF